jgi:1-acyl-sn-glycerol-3-phosphate acyltransferase
LQRFKTGAFELALATGVPVVPIVISGTHNALPKHGFVLQGRHEIGVHVLAPVDPIGPSEQLCEQVRTLIAEQVR